MASLSTVPLAEESLRLYFGHSRAFGYTRTFYYFRPSLPAVNLSLRNQQPGWGMSAMRLLRFCDSSCFRIGLAPQKVPFNYTNLQT